MTTPLRKVTGIGPKTAEFLQQRGIESAEQLLAAGRESLSGAPGFSAARADSVLQAAASMPGAARAAETPAAVEPAEPAGRGRKKKSGKKGGKEKAKQKKGVKEKAKGKGAKKPKKEKKKTKEKKKQKEKKQKKKK